MVQIRILVLALLGCSCVHHSPDDGEHSSVVSIADVPVEARKETIGEAAARIAKTQVGTREIGGNNHGPGPKMYLASVGLTEGPPYCAAGIHWCYRQAGKVLEPAREFAWAPKWSSKGHVVWRGLQDTATVLTGDVSNYFYKKLERVGHVELITASSDRYFEVVGFNTTDGVSRDGDGVFSKLVLRGQTSSASRW